MINLTGIDGVIIFDDVCIKGYTLTGIQKILWDKGVRNCISVVYGTSPSDEKYQEIMGYRL